MVVSIIHSRHKPFIKKLNYYLLAQLPENHNYLKNISRTPTFRAKAFHGNLPCMCSTHNMCADMTYLDILVSGETGKQQETFNIRILGFRECSTVKWFILSE
jgi:hypothetical protein